MDDGDEINPADACVFVLFGASGDLARRKLFPALYRLFLAGNLPHNFRLIGYGRSGMSDEAFQEEAKKALVEFANAEDAANPRLMEFAQCLNYVTGKYNKPEDIKRLGESITKNGESVTVMYYLALPPSVAEKILERFAEGDLPTSNARILMEKPFGSDLESARRLNQLLAKRFEEKNIHRIDHYLAKDTVRNLLVFRFANVIFEPLWSRHYIDHIQVSATESIGVEDRGGFYDNAGVVRDMFQNHVLMLLALATMEPPLAGDAESIRDRISDLLKSIEPPTKSDFVFGQYEGYRETKNVKPDSTTPTFAALRLGIHNWRWDGVPIYLMSGKSLDARVSEISIIFKHIPMTLIESPSAAPEVTNVLTLRIHPNEGIRLDFGVKRPGHLDLVTPASLDFRYSELPADGASGDRIEEALGTFDASGHHLFTGYERVLLEALAGRSGLFWRADGIEAAWKIVDPMLQTENLPDPDDYPTYPVGSSGITLSSSLFRRSKTRWYKANYSVRST